VSTLPTARGERTRRSILDAAYHLFLEQGYSATSMRQIARNAGLALGGIYNHFDSKQAIFREIILENHPYRQVLPLIMTCSGNTIEEFICNAAQAMVGELKQRPDFVKLAFIEMVEFQGKNLASVVPEILSQVLPLVQRFAAMRNDLRDIPPPILFRAFLGMFFSFYMTEYLLQNVEIPGLRENAFDHFVEIFLHGILKEGI
jgi:AcrR family transcriptional regulator